MLPIFMRIHIQEKGRKKVRLFIPVILVWILLFVLFLAFAPLVLVAALILWPFEYGKKLLLAGPLLIGVLCSLSGLGVLVEKKEEKILITAY